MEEFKVSKEELHKMFQRKEIRDTAKEEELIVKYNLPKSLIVRTGEE